LHEVHVLQRHIYTIICSRMASSLPPSFALHFMLCCAALPSHLPCWLLLPCRITVLFDLSILTPLNRCTKLSYQTPTTTRSSPVTSLTSTGWAFYPGDDLYWFLTLICSLGADLTSVFICSAVLDIYEGLLEGKSDVSSRPIDRYALVLCHSDSDLFPQYHIIGSAAAREPTVKGMASSRTGKGSGCGSWTIAKVSRFT
jgi:hypothetical protein